jgi:uncharacterized membrane protein YgcG
MKKFLLSLWTLLLCPLALFAEESSGSMADRIGTFVAAAFFGGVFLYLVINFLLFKFRKCPNCLKRKAQRIDSKEIKAPTYHEVGKSENTYRCSHCGYTFTVVEDIPMLTHHDSDSGSGSSSRGGGGSSSGSWGGGSSSGGGAGGSW